MATHTISSGSTSANFTDNGNGDIWYVSGTASNFTLDASGAPITMTVYNGGVVEGSLTGINQASTLLLEAGATALGIHINNSASITLDNAYASGIYLVNDAHGFASGGIISNGTFGDNGNEHATMAASGGVQIIGGVTSDGGYVSVTSGTLSGMTDEGHIYLSAAAVASGTVIKSTGVLTVSSGGTSLSGTAGSGGTEIISSGGLGTSDTVSSGGTIIVSSGGTETSAVITSSGTLLLESGVISTGDVVRSGGIEILSNTAEEIAGVVSGGTLIASAGTVLSGTASSGGTIVIASGGKGIADTLSSGGSEIVSANGVDSGAIVLASAAMVASAGGTVSNTIVSAGGTLITSSGGVQSNAILSANGIDTVASGGLVSGAVTFAAGATGAVLNLASITSGATELGGAVISGFTSSGQTIDLTGRSSALGATMSETAANTAVLTIGAAHYTFDIAGVTSGASFVLANDGGNLAVEGWCFLEGTLVATPEGEAAVEDLHEDDLVLTASGEAVPVRWIGYRHVVAREMPDSHLYAPVVIEAGAIAPGKPARDLWVTPDHAILVEGCLIPVKLLVNGATIRQVPRAEYSFYHIELDQHALLLAEGLEAESYLDVAASRQAFANNPVTVLHPTASITEETEAAYAERGCRELTVRAEAVKPVWDSIASRAAALGRMAAMPPLTSDPALHLLVDGERLAPSRIEDQRFVFALPANASRVVIASRTAAPWTRAPWLDDRRALGVAVGAIRLTGADGGQAVDISGAAAVSGWHGVERDAVSGLAFRWTDGAAVLALPEGKGARTLELTLRGGLEYETGASSRTVALPGIQAALSRLAG
jgi:autotransporter passenger strand-loop-strand repeat protein